MYRLTMIGLLALTALTGCTSANKCKKACTKVQNCYGETGGAPPCTLSTTCSSTEQCQASCTLNADCAAIMGSDTAGQQSMVKCIAACASTTTDIGVIIPEGGQPDIGISDFQQLADFPVFPVDSTPKPDKPLVTGPPVGKFCNDVLLEGNSFTAVMTIGSGASKATFQAYSGACSPVTGIACPSIPTGLSLPVTVTDGSQTLLSGTLTGEIKNGEEWVFILTVNSSTSQIEFQAGPFNTGYKCQTTDPFAP